MRQFVDILSISTRGRGLVEITREVLNWLEPQAVQAGLLTLFCRHTSAGLVIQENAARDVRADLETFFDRVAPEDGGYRHTDEGADDMPAHIRTVLTGGQLAVPTLRGELALGTWQGFICSSTAARRIGERSPCISLANDAGRTDHTIENAARRRSSR
jgi:secondary thiamine-phosphate synthase enzyme